MNTTTVLNLCNPFRVARLQSELAAVAKVEQINQFDWQPATQDFLRATTKGTDKGKALQMLSLALTVELSEEQKKPRGVRFHGMTTRGVDDAWCVWVVLTREVSAQLLALNDDAPNGYASEFDDACAALWESWGMDPAASGCDADYSPTGRMYSRGLYARRSPGGHVTLSQSGARDV